ncbi:response regulator [Paraglaciecola sp.]|uniref:response regulator n=1 Tax=Paraglaciecola sp. TaxID=1920173 RepID=UPI0030F38DB8
MLKIPDKKTLNEFNVLIIDEQSFAHDVIKSALKDLGVVNIKSAQNAFYALSLCETISFDMVLIAFDVKSDKDGFNLLEEMKFKGFISNTTIVVFLSSNTSPDLVNCVVELQPNDFWVKPLDKLKVEKRIRHILEFEQKLYKLHYCFDLGKYNTAIYLAQRHVVDQDLKTHHPQINRLIGKSLYLMHEYVEAETFYRHLTEKYKFAWVHVELARTLFSLHKNIEAMALIDILLARDDARFSAFDLLAEHYIAKEDFARAYDIIKQSCELAPRNIERNKKCWSLARLNHDRMGQYVATRNMAKYAKNSIHDSPELNLNIIRAGLDLAAVLTGQEAQIIINKIEKDIVTIEGNKSQIKALASQINIIRARLCNLRRDKKGAENLMKDTLKDKTNASFEDNLDKMKVCHEMGEWEQSIALLDNMNLDNQGQSFTAKVLAQYLEQETKERKEIQFSPKELVEMASAHYKGRRYIPAYNLLCQALILSPQNTHFMLSIIKVLVYIAEQDGLNDEQRSSMDSCSEHLKKSTLSDFHRDELNNYLVRIKGASPSLTASM